MKQQNAVDWKVPLPRAGRDQQDNRSPANHHDRQDYEELRAAKAFTLNEASMIMQEQRELFPSSPSSRRGHKDAFAAKIAQSSNMISRKADGSEKMNHPAPSPPSMSFIHPPMTTELNATAVLTGGMSTAGDSSTNTRPIISLSERGLVTTACCCTSSETPPFARNDEAEQEYNSVQPGAYFVRGIEYGSTTSSADQSDTNNPIDIDGDAQEAVVLEGSCEQQEVAVLNAEIAHENSDPRFRTAILEHLRQGRKGHIIFAEHVEREGARCRRRAMAIVCACLTAAAIIVGTTLGITKPNSSTPNFPPPLPTSPPTLPPHCFRSRQALLVAVDEYLEDNSNSTRVAVEYGWPIGTWCVTLITDFSKLFSGDRNPAAKQFNEEIGDWDMSSATTLESMFWSAETFNAGVSSWKTSSVTDTRAMFAFATAFNQDISRWDVSRVTDMWYMFLSSSSFNQALSSWNVGKVTRFEAMFYRATAFNNDISNWDVSSAAVMIDMFNEAAAFNQNISAWNVGKVTTFFRMFKGAADFDQPLSAWEVGNAVSMQSMFQEASSFNQRLSSWDTSGVHDMSSMFRDATAFNQDVSMWEVGVVSDFSGMFNGASRFNQDLCAWGPSMTSDAKVEGMFDGTMCPAANLEVDLLNNPPGPFCNECL